MLAPRVRAVPITLCSVPLVSMRQLLDEAAYGGYGVGAFNVNNMEQIQAIMEAARETRVAGDRAGVARRARLHERPLPLAPDAGGGRALPGDPGRRSTSTTATSPETCISAIELGFTSVMMDGSLEADGKTPAVVRVQRRRHDARSSRYAHARGVTVEGELGTLGGIEDGHGSGEVHLTDPGPGGRVRRARPGSTRSRSRSGRRHGAYKFSQAPDGEVLKMDLIEEIHRRLPDTHLVMHGSSSVPQELVDADQRSTAASSSRPGACRSRRSSSGSATASARSTSTPISRLAITGAIRKVFAETPEASSIRATT